MKNFYPLLQLAVFVFLILPNKSYGQCASLDATYSTYESRCAATGAIKVFVTGGSGNYKYKTTGPVNTNFTTSDSITGLSAGNYTLIINDVGTNCTVTKLNVIVAGTYQDPRFTLAKIDVSCDNASNGSILVDGFSFGRAPFEYSIVSPSPMGIGTTSASGVFPGLMAGNYSIKMTDSCGGIQTRQITIINYTWWIDSHSFTKTGCDEATGFIKVVDSRGNISTVGGIPDFTYGIVRTAGDTIWSTSPSFSFSLMGQSDFQVIARDACGIIKRANTNVSLSPTVAANVVTYDYLCNFFSVSLNVGSNFFTPEFCLNDSSSRQIICNSTGIFTGLAYGSYCITVHDACTDTTISRCFEVTAPPVSVANDVAISDKVCGSFTATVHGQVGLTNPEYCLFDSLNVLIGCNMTGIFTGLSYQPYCITTRDGCRDTTITRCFRPSAPIPVFPSIVVPYYIYCTNFGINIGGDSLTAPQYCLYDSNNVLIICNNTGVFDSIPLGNYCVSIYDSCYDSTVIRCLSVLVPVVTNDMVVSASHKTCSGFTLSASSNNLVAPEFCLYNDADVLISCNLSGEFINIPYGSYCVKTEVPCPDTTLISCISVYPDLPEVGGTVLTSQLTCTSFTAEITDQQNLTNPTYCIYDSMNVLVACNTIGQFTNLAYGSYCIKITDGCYDTTVTRCFNQAAIRVSLTGNAGKSCSYGWAQFNLNMGGNSGYLPVNIKIYKPDGSFYSEANYNTNAVLIDSIPGTGSGEYYTIVATDNCGNQDSISLGSPASFFTRSPVVIPKCPSAIWANGSGNIQSTILTNMGSLSVRIIKRNGATLFPSITANTVISGVYTFLDLGPGTYIMQCSENFCSRKLYDTLIIRNYQYPNLDRSSAYQCDVNGFSVSAIATNGVGPFSYEIIGSQPTTPVITSAPQSNPIFTINNGANYSLIRLRALDACGNATLGDASILPLAINGVISSEDCLLQPTTLSVDSFYNSTYTWYKKVDESSTDSTLLGTGTSYFIPAVQPADTGVYICYVSVNSGCINRTFIFHLGGNCWIVLPVELTHFSGRVKGDKNLLTWKISGEGSFDHFVVERQNSGTKFSETGLVAAIISPQETQQYNFVDLQPADGSNHYRLKLVKRDGSFAFSNTIVLSNDQDNNSIAIYPNPIKDKFVINLGKASNHRYKISLLNTTNQILSELTQTGNGSNLLEMQRPRGIQKGVYILVIHDLTKKMVFKQKIVFL